MDGESAGPTASQQRTTRVAAAAVVAACARRLMADESRRFHRQRQSGGGSTAACEQRLDPVEPASYLGQLVHKLVLDRTDLSDLALDPLDILPKEPFRHRTGKKRDEVVPTGQAVKLLRVVRREHPNGRSADTPEASHRAGCRLSPVSDDNVWSDEWPADEDWSGGGSRSRRLPRGQELGASVYELGPSNWVPFHFHHASEELLIVLRGRPTLRTNDRSRQLDEGDVVHFATGPDGAHGLSNETDRSVRYVIASTLKSPEVAEYPDIKKITAEAQTQSQTGDRLWLIHDLD